MRKAGKCFVVILAALQLFAILLLFYSVIKTGEGNYTANEWNQELQQFVDELCSGCDDDAAKIKRIYDWITENIEYDEQADELIYQHFDIYKTLQSKKGVCFDFSNLFAVFCRSQGIPCHVLDGYSCSDRNYLHTWNRVYFNNGWWNADLSYDSAQKNEEAKYGFVSIGEAVDAPDKKYVITRIY